MAVSIAASQRLTRKLERSIEVIMDKFAKNVESFIKFKKSNLRRPVFASGLNILISPDSQASPNSKTNNQVLELYENTGS